MSKWTRRNRIHVHVHLPAIYAYTYTNSNSNTGTQIYTDATASSYPGTAAVTDDAVIRVYDDADNFDRDARLVEKSGIVPDRQSLCTVITFLA